MSEIQVNTTQNVKIAYAAAGVGERLVAYIIDILIKWGYLMAVSYLFGAFENMDQWSQIALNTLLSLPVIFYTLVLELLLNGQTLGKKVMKIKVVKIDGYQASVTDYVIRWFFRIIDIFFFGIAFFFILFTKRNQRIGDLAAGTSVVLLKDKVKFSHTIFEDLSEAYVPSYPSVIKLSDNDARIIKEAFTDARQANDFKTLIKLRTKIMEVAEIKHKKEGTDIQFIDTVLKDYNFYTQNM
ncbi:MAG: RDD family protein [Alteromonas sp.]|nr:RDD family protein [Alteromonas sp.]MAY23125.1 RDD family protein [Flavobacteriaceae bacterium]|tara:strand:+ start:164153 stop:164872 length:720 start_codon:yes stop_codon:yes gene_type:complete